MNYYGMNLHVFMENCARASTCKPARDFAKTPGWAVSIDTIFSRNLFWKSPHKAIVPVTNHRLGLAAPGPPSWPPARKPTFLHNINIDNKLGLFAGPAEPARHDNISEFFVGPVAQTYQF